MRTIIKALLIIHYIIISQIVIAGEAIDNDRYTIHKMENYTISTPKEWVKISQSKTDSLKNDQLTLLSNAGLPSNNLSVIGYSESDTNGNEFPLLIGVYYDIPNYTSIPFDSIVTINTRTWLKHGLKNKPVVDDINKRFYIEIVLEDIFLFIGYLPTNEGMLQLCYYTYANDLDIRKSQFFEVYKSVKIKQKHYYIDQVKIAEKNMDTSGKYLLFALGTVVLAGVGRYIKKQSFDKTKDQ